MSEFRRERTLVEIHCDAFAQGGGKSALSTAAAELTAQLEAMVVGRSIRALLGSLERDALKGSPRACRATGGLDI